MIHVPVLWFRMDDNDADSLDNETDLDADLASYVMAFGWFNLSTHLDLGMKKNPS